MTDSHTDTNEIILDGMRFKVEAGPNGLMPVGVQELATYPSKQLFGDATKDSHRYLSSWVLDDLSGGHGVAKLRGTDLNRFRIGNLDVRKPSQWVLPPKAAQVTGPNSDGCKVLGDLAGEFYLTYGTAVRIWDEATDTHSAATGGTLTAAPTNRAVSFAGTGAARLFIPQGAGGYDTYSGTAVVHAAAPLAVSFLVWDNKLLCIDTAGQIHSSLDGTTWTNEGPEAKLDSTYTPHHLVNYFDRIGTPTPFIITNRDLWALDMAGPVLYRTELNFPPHSRQGLGVSSWRGDLYVSVGMGVHRYNGAVVSAMGLDRDHGLPTELRGKIVDLCGEYNGLYALVAGADNITVSDESFLYDVFDDELYVGANNTISSLHVWTGFGWHEVWVAPNLGGTPSWCVVSDVDEVHRLWWGIGGDAYTMTIPIDFTNPRGLIEAGEGSFESTGTIQTGRFDADMKNYPKIANAVEIDGDFFTESSGSFQIQYQIDGTGGFQTLGTVTTDGIKVLPFGTVDDYGNAEGVGFFDIELQATMTNGSGVTTVSPLIDSAILTFLKVPTSTLNWTVQVDLSASYAGNSPEVMAAKIDELIATTAFYTMVHRDTDYRVRITNWNGAQETGYDTRQQRTLTILQVKERA